MLEHFFLEKERNLSFGYILFGTFILTVILGGVNYFIGGNSLFLVGLVALALAYPTVTFLREETKKEFTKKLNFKEILEEYENELVVFWCIFLGITFGFYTVFPLLENVQAQENFISQVSGHITQTTNSFWTILNNNLIVGLLTFLLSLVTFSGILFVLSWNASILAYYIWSAASTSSNIFKNLLVLPHGLLEIGGYIFFALAGMILSYKVDTKDMKENIIPKQVRKEFIILLIGGLLFIFLGALFETL